MNATSQYDMHDVRLLALAVIKAESEGRPDEAAFLIATSTYQPGHLMYEAVSLAAQIVRRVDGGSALIEGLRDRTLLAISQATA